MEIQGPGRSVGKGGRRFVTAADIIRRLGPLVGNTRLAEPPPANTMRGIDFYGLAEFVSAFVVSLRHFRRSHGRLPRLMSPTSFNEHIAARKFFAPMPLPSLGDKLGVRDYVRARLGEDALIPVVWAGDHIDDLFTADLPAGRFVLKANHGSGMNMFLDLPQDLTARRDEIRSEAQTWLAMRFGRRGGEWHYSVFRPKLFLEAFLCRDDKLSMPDFKVHCFHGKARLIQAVTGRFAHKQHGQYTPDWTPLAGMPSCESIEFARPKNLDSLLESAERLAQGLEYARIDLYTDFEQVVKFGEITLTPGNGLEPFSDLEFDRWLGAFFTPPVDG